MPPKSKFVEPRGSIEFFVGKGNTNEGAVKRGDSGDSSLTVGAAQVNEAELMAKKAAHAGVTSAAEVSVNPLLQGMDSPRMFRRSSETWDKVQRHHASSIRGGQKQGSYHNNRPSPLKEAADGEDQDGDGPLQQQPSEDYDADALADLFAVAGGVSPSP